MQYHLIGRLHIGGKNNKNNFSQLALHLNKKLYPLESTKASILLQDNEYRIIETKIKKYNQKYNTDFFIE